jgi:sugar O-acyltransferase (sialic acid O-acetyltransferase NeuD family)
VKQPLAIFGAGGFGREVLQVVLDLNQAHPDDPPWAPVGFVVDPVWAGGATVHGLSLLPGVAWVAEHPDVHVVLAIGASAVRRRLALELDAVGHQNFATLVHPRAWLGRGIELGAGSVICAGSQMTTDIRCGRHVHVNIGTTVGHDVVLGDFVTVNPGVNISGNVSLGEGSEIGTGSILIPHADVGPWSIVGAGTVVTRALPANVTAVGAPARVVKKREPGWHTVPDQGK